MVQKLISNFFDIRKGEMKVSLFMFSYIFLVIAVLLIVKPTVNALFLSELGPDQLPFGFLLVALAAIGSSLGYSRLLAKFQLKKIIATTLLGSTIILVVLALLLLRGLMQSWMLYFFYTWVAIYAVLTASQFWVLANVVFNVRDAKRVFGLIGSGGILGGIFGGYLTSFLAPLIGNGMMVLFAAAILLALVPLLHKIWKDYVTETVKDHHSVKKITVQENAFRLVKNSPHLKNIALVVGISVLVAKLVDFLFSDFATQTITDPDELSSFFGFWFSTFNLVSFGVQIFLTHRIVGIWGVGFSLLLLPLGVLFGSVAFLFFPELLMILLIKAMDGIFKQSINKSAFELLSLPIPLEKKKRAKFFIDVVVDSIATGMAGVILIFLIKGFEWNSIQIAWLCLFLALVWCLLIYRVRKTYYETFRKNLISDMEVDQKSLTKENKKPTIQLMQKVFETGSEKQVLYMLDKCMEINDKRLSESVRNLLDHPSKEVKLAALKNLYFLDSKSMPATITNLFKERDQKITQAVLEFLLLHSRNDTAPIFEQYLESKDILIAEAALSALARESSNNLRLRNRYQLEKRLRQKLQEKAIHTPAFLRALAYTKNPEFYPPIHQALVSEDPEVTIAAIEASSITIDYAFVPVLTNLLTEKELRPFVLQAFVNYGSGIIPYLKRLLINQELPIEQARFIPRVIGAFRNQASANCLLEIFEEVDHSVRNEVVSELGKVRSINPDIKFGRLLIANRILDECRLYHKTLSAMHTQIIVSYRNRKKTTQEVLQEERDARASLLDILERRLDGGLGRIFMLLGLRYVQEDIQLAYKKLTSDEEDARSSAIDFLDNLLTGNLKQRVLPIIEEAVKDFSREEDIHLLSTKILTEHECFEQLLKIRDINLNLGVIYLIGKQRDVKYKPLLESLAKSPNLKIRDFAANALAEFSKN